MLPCYGVVRASWVGLVTTLTAYVEGGGGRGAVWRPGDNTVTQLRLWPASKAVELPALTAWPEKLLCARTGQRALRATHGRGGGGGEASTVREKGARQSTSWRPEHSGAAASKTCSLAP